MAGVALISGLAAALHWLGAVAVLGAARELDTIGAHGARPTREAAESQDKANI